MFGTPHVQKDPAVHGFGPHDHERFGGSGRGALAVEQAGRHELVARRAQQVGIGGDFTTPDKCR